MGAGRQITHTAPRRRYRYAFPARRGRIARGYTRRAGYFGRMQPFGGELKFHDLDIDDAIVATAGTIAQDCCVIIPQGVTESNRVGRKCVIRSINWRMQIGLAETDGGTSAPSPDIVRVILYLDKQTNGAAATVADILESADFQSFNNLANKGRFRTLMDRVYTVNLNAGGVGTVADQDWAATTMADSFFLKCAIPIEWDNSAATGVLTSVRTNNIGVLTISQNGRCNFGSKMRLRFSDT